jgi:hypothetical protein
MEMSEMIERMARAAHEVVERIPAIRWEDCHPDYRAAKRFEARASLVALQKPTDAMVQAGLEQYEQEQGGMSSERIIVVVGDGIWPAMIAAALEE